MYRVYFNKVKGSKYRNVRQTYNGYNYDSRFEAQHAMMLDQQLKEGFIKAWERQYKVSIEYEGKLICNYFCDFRITNNDGSYTLLEVKGIETPVYRLKRKLLETIWLPQHLDHEYTVSK